MPAGSRTLFVVLLAVSCSEDPSQLREWRPDDHGQPAAPPPDRQPDAPAEALTPEQAEARARTALWNVSCASCHGRDGSGGGPGLPPGTRVPDLRSTQRTDAELLEIIANGRGLMPPFGQKLSEASIAALVAHVRSLGAASGEQTP
jgi:mono/diheme cytochrome c family protein